MKKPAFIITLDTEGDNLWENEHNITTQNTHFLPRFQQLCERFQFKPVWLTNYEMAIDEAYIEFAQDVIARNTGEIGMHLHAWNSPPIVALTDNDLHYQPYLIEYPKSQMRDKIAFMTDLLENKLQTKMLSHRAGRWAFNETYAQLLIEFGYQVDCSVTPKVDWRFTKGDPAQSGGTDYSNFPSHAYFMDVNDISKAGNSTLLEVPMSIQYKHSPFMNKIKRGYDRLRGKRRSPSVNWLRPKGGNAQQMIEVAQKSLAQGHSHIEFMLHSSEFMPGGSPTFRTEQDIDGLYNDLETLFNFLQDKVQGMTLAEYYQNKVQAK
ncbi:TPA: polysaccharide deacetylase family protein [Proteus mirabilis]|uniref:Lipopolysaccharide core biosynthesis protein n=1 Tax=Proteus mirabilis (strain HI4320) TaxID=529507 RepID=B4F127_PROMH|nr:MULTISPECIES: polysaccharide deacetylase family protein [Proteus]ECG2669680.1 deacetylase [Salmonella enterica subsp. enterica serovar Takoradi]EKT8674741.1 polysaccharide deacetylase family protein [Proteus mirabilis]EKW0401290.1 polysaccharide deacetylase family protein [Proteus mirabilis]EKW4513142.1 polysaccharide deacetylase family protein [Proteus mirabilis]MBG2784436.1 polysaccharide deacetylase family protein [Proteus mirabilis]